MMKENERKSQMDRMTLKNRILLLSFLQYHYFDPEHETAIRHPKQLEAGEVVV
ncbi:hypothetical protein [Paenibacillus sp. LHD-38]|uniref:hypothetical protein n=1 Tax=Paenibacillus sp. LHD-38 TaxID=3072143 RepID=UPI00280E8A42|nr:hypothetical protein [Paenibacillus sp. LHD-38]MDQ8735967.1 hypothetical protein [Paenibacillus sp. LHD-38]